METREETWKPVKGHEKRFLISNHGRVKSIGGRYKVSMKNEGYIFVGTIDGLGYRIATLRDKDNPRKVRIHTLVAEHFCQRPKQIKNLQVNHKDGDKLNNYYLNLEWVTPLQNIRHAVSIGLMNFKGEKHHNAKLTNEKVIEMRRLRKEGLTHQKIANMFGVNRRQAGDVINGVNWGWLKTGLD